MINKERKRDPEAVTKLSPAVWRDSFPVPAISLRTDRYPGTGHIGILLRTSP